MRVLFPSEPFDDKIVDSYFEDELRAAQKAECETHLLDAEALQERRFDRAVHLISSNVTGEHVVLRGWVLPVASYAGLHDALRRRGIKLINRPAEYEYAQHVPLHFDVIAEHGVRTRWTDSPDIQWSEIAPLLKAFADRPVVIKDWGQLPTQPLVVRAANDVAAVERAVRKLVEQQGGSLTGGLLFHEAEAFAPLASVKRSNWVATEEYRYYILDKQPLCLTPKWFEGDATLPPPPLDLFSNVVANVKSQFFTMDVARKKDGTFCITELGDAQVSGLPDRLQPAVLYRELASRLE